MWLTLTIFSALSLGIYNVLQKRALNGNALLPVLFLSIVSSSILLSPLMILSRIAPEMLPAPSFYVPEIDLRTHLFIFLKAVIVLASWIFGYAGMKHLPLTLVSPINAMQPVWTIVGAIVLYGEILSCGQAGVLALTLLCFYLISRIGRQENVSFLHNRWVLCIILSTLIGASSDLYDKFLMHRFDRMAVQVWFTWYQGLLMLIVCALLWFPRRREHRFRFRVSILLIGVFLSLSDFFYFHALSHPDSLIAIVSPIRRSAMLIPFTVGALLYHEKQVRKKLPCMLGILTGVCLLFLLSR
ncbi:MAG: EamA family transporter [Paludibacteraceae bacterium]|nr:EamA family transporter [Paludibacteraceae bacterium]